MERRSFVKHTALAGLSAPFYISSPTTYNKKPEIIGHGDYKYRVHHNWGDLNPTEHPIKNCHEMILDNKGRLIMVGDHTKNNVLIYDKSGKLLDYWGIRYTQGHGLTHWDAGGDEFLFICDPHWGSTKEKGQSSVVKTTLYGRELMKLDHPSNYSDDFPEDLGYAPTETAIGPNGDIYIADGYGSSYIVQFSQDGEYIRKFGGKGEGENQLLTPHGITVDYRDKENPTLMVTSRARNCFKRYTLDGKYLETIHTPAAFVCRPVIDEETLYAGVCWSSALRYDPEDAQNTHPYNISPNSGFVTILDKNHRVVSNPGGQEPIYQNGALQPMLQAEPVFKHCHDVCIDEDKNIYVCQWNADGAYPTKLERV